jgi:hypothetical protein
MHPARVRLPPPPPPESRSATSAGRKTPPSPASRSPPTGSSRRGRTGRRAARPRSGLAAAPPLTASSRPEPLPSAPPPQVLRLSRAPRLLAGRAAAAPPPIAIPALPGSSDGPSLGKPAGARPGLLGMQCAFQCAACESASPEPHSCDNSSRRIFARPTPNSPRSRAPPPAAPGSARPHRSRARAGCARALLRAHAREAARAHSVLSRSFACRAFVPARTPCSASQWPRGPVLPDVPCAPRTRHQGPASPWRARMHGAARPSRCPSWAAAAGTRARMHIQHARTHAPTRRLMQRGAASPGSLPCLHVLLLLTARQAGFPAMDCAPDCARRLPPTAPPPVTAPTPLWR